MATHLLLWYQELCQPVTVSPLKSLFFSSDSYHFSTGMGCGIVALCGPKNSSFLYPTVTLELHKCPRFYSFLHVSLKIHLHSPHIVIHPTLTFSWFILIIRPSRAGSHIHVHIHESGLDELSALTIIIVSNIMQKLCQLCSIDKLKVAHILANQHLSYGPKIFV